MEKGPQASKVLIVDDDYFFREILQKCLSDKGIRAMGVESVDQAIRAVEIFSPNLIVSDMRMPEKTGLDLLHWIKGNHPLVPTILVTGFSELLDSAKASELGAAGFLSKPFKEADLIRMLEEVGRETGENPSEPRRAAADNLDAEYMKVCVEDFISGGQIQYPIYLRLPSAEEVKFVKVAHTGEDLTLERIRSYREHGVRHLYLQKDDYMRYVGLTVRVTKAAQSSAIPKEKKARLLRHTMELVEQQVFVGELSREAFENASTLIEVGTRMLSTPDAGYLLLESVREISDELYAHSTAVSMIASLIARAVGWTSPKTLAKVSLAGMLHDIGKRQLPKELSTKPRSQMSLDELIHYETHPRRGMEILSDVDFIPSDVIQAVYQHHERGNGSGFPGHLNDNKIFPLAKVLAVADEFCAIYMSSGDHQNRNAKRSIMKLVDFYSDGLSAEALIGLHRTFQLDPPESLLKKVKKESS